MADQIEVAATVPVFKDYQEHDGSRYTAYIVRVQTSFGDMWELKKRYSDFADLHTQLQKHHSHLQEFKFPHKSMFNTFADFTKLRRLSGFQEYIKLLMELKPRPVELDQFLELDEHLLNRNGVTVVTTAGKTSAAGQASETHQGVGGNASDVDAQGTSTGVSCQGNSEQQQIVRIVISSFITMILSFWALATAQIIDLASYTNVRVALTLLSLGSVCTFMRIALLKREQRQTGKMKAS